MKSIRFEILVVAILCASTIHLLGQGPNPQAPTGSTPRLLADIENGRKEADRKLDAAFQKAVHAVEISEKISSGRTKMVVDSLKASQAAWQDFRYKQRAFLYSYYYQEIGSLGARAAGIWEYEQHLIDQRIKELEEPPNYF